MWAHVHPTKRADSNSGPFPLVRETRTTCNAREIPHAFEPPAEFPGKKFEMQYSNYLSRPVPKFLLLAIGIDGIKQGIPL